MARKALLVSALLMIGATSLWALDLKGLVLYLPFDEGKGGTAKDASGNGNDGDLNGGAEWADGKFGKAIHLPDDAPDNMVVVKDNDSLDLTDAISFAAWVRVDAMPDSHNALISKADTYMIHTSTWANRGVEMEPLIFVGGQFGAWQTPASVPIPFKEWHHVAAVWDGLKIVTYIDGEALGEVARKGTNTTTDADVVIGRDSRGCCANRKSDQTIDDLWLWGRALSKNEIKEIMAGNALAVEAQGKLATRWAALKAR